MTTFKRLLALITLATILTGCTTEPDSEQASNAIEATEQAENDTDYTLVTAVPNGAGSHYLVESDDFENAPELTEEESERYKIEDFKQYRMKLDTEAQDGFEYIEEVNN